LPGETPFRTLSRYELLEEIGRGNMGVVFRAHDPAMNRTVALKILRFGFSLEEKERAVFVERFHREARIAGRLSHPGIVAVHDFGSGEEPFLVMEYFPGVSLQKLLERGPLSVAEVEGIARQLGHALAYAHAEGVVHRDIKPGNVLFRDGQLKLVDFGIARMDVSDLTGTGELIGTPSYMPPEIFSGQPVDRRSDLFSLGVVLYQLLTGVRPFDGPSVSRTIYRVLHDDPLPPSRTREGIPTGWDVLVRNLLAKDPNERYQGAEELLEDLDRLARGEKLTVKAGSDPTEPLARPSGRALSRLVPIALVLLLAIGVAGISLRSPTEGPEEAPLATVATAPSLAFVARHEHAMGHCTGDLSLGEEGIVFASSRHRAWRWGPEDVESLSSRSEDEIELRARSRERGRRDEMETFRFTFLRPPLTQADLEPYVRWVNERRE
jgi:serine/threonine-protein kinase